MGHGMHAKGREEKGLASSVRGEGRRWPRGSMSHSPHEGGPRGGEATPLSHSASRAVRRSDLSAALRCGACLLACLLTYYLTYLPTYPRGFSPSFAAASS